ncbi:zinc ABC transporter substrate-binding protein [Candidatus Liberibacter asiaticus]|uniref:High-affinity zinc uptake system protein ZnuA n=2 Tax=Liberibacter asiaticus TaxID=34021 RepID=C6XFN7_LIBAP|nr:zinc ABC transporter substrate-binding protein [Candidatus Liberibacter asiaticus]ACT57190.1 zinc uptake ABC transporter [Candidatus Liberibacter asiaticus str. psy62]AGH16847.1 zinc uptake ABC transporter [Candidatus Liberibacter asiaticus str. gxpsy]ALK07205.1 zinc ABC transporter [Candidatus Liberibacter asiaticus]ASK52686.1 zinc ABC transporter [Candidatus Liberibacter asiaticus]AWL14011.1 zinc ABC transporter [Candidatus Liberibacter asiaticus]
MKNFLIILIFLFFILSSVARAGSLQVVVSIKPIHSIVSCIMQGIGTPALLVKGASSPHEYSLRISEAMMLENADIIFWLGAEMESFLVKPLHSLNKQSNVVTLSHSPDLHRILLRDNHSHFHDSEADDLHLWLNPLNVQYIAHVIAMELIKKDPRNKIIYEKNEEEFKNQLSQLDKELHSILQPVEKKKIIVFHEAYRYFASHYNLSIVTFPMSHSVFMGAASLRNIRSKIISDKISCLFYGPEFDSKIIRSITNDTGVMSAILDPEGMLIAEGPELYFQLMRSMSNSIAKNCS